jgi:hypothetical protein
MTKRTAKPRPLTLDITVLRKLTEDELRFAAGGLMSEASCADQGCERRRA